MTARPDEDSAAQRLHRELFSPIDPTKTVPVARAHLTDRRRLAVLLQGAALLAHCEQRGLCLPEGWQGARVDAHGLLWLPELVVGRAADYPQIALLDLMEQLFRSRGAPAGRGEARRSARQIEIQLRQRLTPIPAEWIVHEILDNADFLWGRAFAAARRRLMAVTAEGLSIAAPGASSRRLSRLAGKDLQELADLLESPRARDAWEGFDAETDPETHARSGRWRQALAGWRRRGTLDARAALGMARAAMALGRHQLALDTLESRRGVAARLLRARCQYRVGKLKASLASLRKLEDAKLDDEQRLELAGLLGQVLAALGRRDAIGERVENVLDSVDGPAHALAMVRAGAAWDRGALDAAGEQLELARPGALEDPQWVGRWYHLAGQRALLDSDGLRAEEYLAKALRLDRRTLTPFRAARLWSDLSMARVFSGNLAAAERACLHAARLSRGARGPVRSALVLYNLAEVRLRRGRLTDIEPVLEESTAGNRRAGNRKGLVRDLELWVRFELAQGRAEEALTRCVEARAELRDGDPEGRAGVFELFAARAHGWLGRPERAAACLEGVRNGDLLELETEERPAVLALAGRFDEAVAESAGSPWSSLWTALVGGVAPEPRCWEALGSLEPYRAARLIFDCEQLRHGVAPPSRVRWSVAVLREAGAGRLADTLERRSLGPWRALEVYGSSDRGTQAVAELLRSAGYGEARLSWHSDGAVVASGDFEPEIEEVVLVDGEGGDDLLRVPWKGGRLVLAAPRIDPILRAVFSLLRSDLQAPDHSSLVDGSDDSQITSRDRHPPAGGRGGIIGGSPALVLALDRLERLARSELPLLLLGESGTGKELFARHGHRLSPRSREQFLPINCAALSESLIQSDLFGHVRGAFTGADRDRQGVFEAARGGTVFLDEIGDLPSSAQGKLLRVLQEGEVRRLGESHSRKVDVRVIAATHRDLAQMVEDGDFRNDLYYRLKVAAVELPPLRDRGQDILTIAEHLLEQQRRHRPGLRLSSAAEARLLAHDWPGNVRELRNVLDLATALSEDGLIEPLHLELPRHEEKTMGVYQELVESYRRRLIQEALDASGGNQSEAARRLGLTRQALSYLVRSLGLL